MIESLGLAVASAIITYFFIRPLSSDCMEKEDEEVSSRFFEAIYWADRKT